jgi:Flp pilus assembly protein TadG
VEIAILLPFFMAILLGALELARGMNVVASLDEAARRGCRQGIQSGADSTAVSDVVKTALQERGITPADVTISIQVNDQNADVATAQTNDRISVKLTVPASKVSWTPVLFLHNRNIESKRVVMLRQ